jgi:hypothetical protein
MDTVYISYVTSVDTDQHVHPGNQITSVCILFASWLVDLKVNNVVQCMGKLIQI